MHQIIPCYIYEMLREILTLLGISLFSLLLLLYMEDRASVAVGFFCGAAWIWAFQQLEISEQRGGDWSGEEPRLNSPTDRWSSSEASGQREGSAEGDTESGGSNGGIKSSRAGTTKGQNVIKRP